MKENRQGCLSRSIRAGGIRSVIKETLPGRPTKKDAKRRPFLLVGMTGFEPATSASRTQRSTKLSHAPFQLPNYSNTFSGVCLVNFFNLWYNTKKEWRRTMKHTALITGASRGIGAALACRFAAEGYHLALCCHNSYETLQALATKLETTYSIQVLCFRGDVGDYTFICDMVQKTLDTFGQIDVLINNAGISYIGLLTDMDITDWNRIVATNLTSVFSTCRQVIPSMVHAKSGHIINISSVWGNVGASCEVAYSACKGGINSLTRALGKELAPSNIQVNAIACGVIDTDMNRCFSEEERSALIEEIPAGRMGSPEEVASLAYSLATASSYLNGQILALDGGWI